MRRNNNKEAMGAWAYLISVSFVSKSASLTVEKDIDLKGVTRKIRHQTADL